MATNASRVNSPVLGLEQSEISRRPSRSFWQDAWARFIAQRISVIAGIIFVALCLLAVAAPLVSQYVTGYDPNRINLREDYQTPNAKHWFGTDEYGRDYFTRIVWAGRVSLSIGFAVALISLTIGVILGIAAGYYGKVFDDFLQGAINLWGSIPQLPLLIIIGSMFQLTPLTLVFLLAVFGWIGSSRYIRGLVLSLKQRDYITAAQSLGASNNRIMFQHILPNVFASVLVIAGFDVIGAIFTESGLSFLGFGISPPTATWGNMLTNSLSNASRNPWLVVFPGLAISITTLSLFLLADGLRDATDPKLRNK